VLEAAIHAASELGDASDAARMHALARLDTPRAAEALCAALVPLGADKRAEDFPLVLGRCLGGMTQMPPARLAVMLQNDNWRARQAALAALSVQHAAESIPHALQALTDPQPQVRAIAAELLGLAQATAARPALTAALADPYPTVRAAAATALDALPDQTLPAEENQ